MPSNAELDAQYSQLLARDPEIMRLARALQSAPGTGVTDGRALQGSGQKQAIWNQLIARAKTLGVPTDDWALSWESGQPGVDHKNFFEKHPVIAALLIGGSFLGGAGVIGALGGGAATGGSAAATGGGTAAATGSSVIPATAGYGAPSAVAGGSVASSTAAAGVPGAVTTAGTGGGWAAKLFGDGVAQDLLKAGIGSGVNYLAQRSQRNADRESVDRAIEEERKATREANSRLDRQERLSGDIYNRQRTDFQNLANKPFQTLGSLLGMDIPDIGPVTFQNQAPPAGQLQSAPPPPGPSGTFNPNGRLGQPGTTAPPTGRSLQDFSNMPPMVTMKAPTGETQQVKAQDVGFYESRGATRV